MVIGAGAGGGVKVVLLITTMAEDVLVVGHGVLLVVGQGFDLVQGDEEGVGYGFMVDLVHVVEV